MTVGEPSSLVALITGIWVIAFGVTIAKSRSRPEGSDQGVVMVCGRRMLAILCGLSIAACTGDGHDSVTDTAGVVAANAQRDSAHPSAIQTDPDTAGAMRARLASADGSAWARWRRLSMFSVKARAHS